MNLVESYILEVVSVKDISKEYTEYMRSHSYPKFEIQEPMLEVVCKENCYGVEEIKDHHWTKSQYEKYQKQGYYLS